MLSFNQTDRNLLFAAPPVLSATRVIELRGALSAVEMNLAWSGPRTNSSKGPPAIRDIQLVRITGTARAGGMIAGLRDSLIRKGAFQDCSISARTGLVLRNAEERALSGLELTVKPGPAILHSDPALDVGR